jgi:hypothetical protein
LSAPDESVQSAMARLELPITRIHRRTDKAYYAEKADRITIRHHLGRIVAFIEIVSPGNKDGDRALEQFVVKIADAMQQGVHVLVLDLFPQHCARQLQIHTSV